MRSYPYQDTGINTSPAVSLIRSATIMDTAALIKELFWGFEIHDPQKIKTCIEHGLSMTEPINGRKPVDILIRQASKTGTRFHALLLLLKGRLYCTSVLSMAGASVPNCC